MGYVFDFVVVFAALASLVIGLRRGLIREVIELVAIIAGSVTTAICQRLGVGFLDSVGGSAEAGRLLTMIAQFACGAASAFLLGHLLRKLIHWTPLAILDWLGGAIAAVAKCVVLFSFLLLAAVRHPVLGVEWIRQSIVAPLLLFVARVILVLFPSDFAQGVREFLAGF